MKLIGVYDGSIFIAPFEWQIEKPCLIEKKWQWFITFPSHFELPLYPQKIFLLVQAELLITTCIYQVGMNTLVFEHGSESQALEMSLGGRTPLLGELQSWSGQVQCVSVGMSDVTVQRQKDWLATEKPELLGWDTDQ